MSSTSRQSGRIASTTTKLLFAGFVLGILLGSASAVAATSSALPTSVVHLPGAPHSAAVSSAPSLLRAPTATTPFQATAVLHTGVPSALTARDASAMSQKSFPRPSTLPYTSPALFNASAGTGAYYVTVDTTSGVIYTTDVFGTTVTALSPTTGLTLATIPVGSNPQGIAFDPVHNQLFVADYSTGNVTVINALTNKPVASIGVGATSQPQYVTYDPLNKMVYVSEETGDNLTVINPATDKTVGSAPAGVEPSEIVVDPSNGYLYVPNFGSGNLTVVSPTYLNSKANLSIGGLAGGAAFDPTTGEVYVASISTPEVQAIGEWPPVVTGTAPLQSTGEPRGVVYDPGTGELYVGNSVLNMVAVVNPTTMSLVTDIPRMYNSWFGTYDSLNGEVYYAEVGVDSVAGISNVGMGAVSSFTDAALDLVGSYLSQPAIDPTTGLLFVPAGNYDDLLVVDISTGAVLGILPTGAGPENAWFDPQNHEIFVSNEVGANLTVFSEGTPRAIASIPVGTEPYGMTFDPQTGLLYVADNGGSDLSVVSTVSNSLVGTISLPNCVEPWIPTYDSADQDVYVSCTLAASIQVVSTLNDSAKGMLYLNPIYAPGAGLLTPVVDPASGTLFVDSSSVPWVEIFSTANNKSLANVSSLDLSAGYFGGLDPVTHQVLFFGGGGTEVFSPSALTNTWLTEPLVSTTAYTLGGVYDPATGLWVTVVDDYTAPADYVALEDAGPAAAGIDSSTGVAGGDVGASLTLTATAATSPMPVTDSSFWGVPGCVATAVRGSAYTCTPTASGAYTLVSTVQDADGMASTIDTTFSIHAAPTATPTLLSPSATVDVGQTLRFQATTTGGWAGGSFAWTSSSALGCAASTNAWLNCTTVSNGTGLTVSVAWTDGAGATTAIGASAPLTVVWGPAVVGAPVANSWNPVGDDVGQTVTFTSTLAGGVGPFTYAWNGLPGCLSMSAASLSCFVATPGSYSVWVAVTDADGVTADSPALAYTVSAAPSVTVGITPTSASVDVGESVDFTALASGGAAGGSFLWKDLPSALGCLNSTDAVLVCWPTAAAATTSVEVAWTDANGVQTSWVTGTVSVSPALSVAPLTASVSSLDVGQSVSFTDSVAGGATPYTYHWSGLPGCAPAVAPTLTCTASKAGVFATTLTIVDNVGMNITSMPVGIDVSPALGTPVVSASSTSVEEGTSVAFSASVSGGAAPYTYSWTGLPSGCAAANAAVIVCTPSSSGSISVTVTVKDANGASETSAASSSVSVSSTGSLESSASGMLALELAAAGLALAVVALLVALLRKGKSGPKASAPMTTTPTPPEPAPASPPPPPPPPPA